MYKESETIFKLQTLDGRFGGTWTNLHNWYLCGRLYKRTKLGFARKWYFYLPQKCTFSAWNWRRKPTLPLHFLKIYSPFVRSFVRSLARSIVLSCVRSFVRLFFRWAERSGDRSFVRSFVLSLIWFLFLDRLVSLNNCYVCLNKRWNSLRIRSLYRCKFHISVCKKLIFHFTKGHDCSWIITLHIGNLL